MQTDGRTYKIFAFVNCL
uniref:Uncharacterized protein n=1 Tax=Romanomermis culicivorax TaxID=13658 RepID=A0A915HFT5_ROMCU